MQRAGLHREYPLLFTYVLLLFLLGAGEWAAVRVYPLSSVAYASVYWTNELVLQALLIVLPASFRARILDTSAAKEHRPMRRLAWSIGLSAAIAGVCLLPLAASPVTRSVGATLNAAARNLSFGTAAMTFILWCALLRSRVRSHQLLLLASGLGILASGKAIGYSLRYLLPTASASGSAVVVVASLICLSIWLLALARVPRPERALPG